MENLQQRRRKKERVPELLGGVETAEILGVAPSNLQFIRDLPEPVAHLSAGKIWLKDDIVDFEKIYSARRSARRAA